MLAKSGLRSGDVEYYYKYYYHTLTTWKGYRRRVCVHHVRGDLIVSCEKIQIHGSVATLE